MTPAPIADYLRTPLAAVRGKSGDRDALKAWLTRKRGYLRLSITFRNWVWYRNMARDATTTRRVWLNPEHWGADRMDVWGDAELKIAAIPAVWPNTPAVIPWGPGFLTGTAPAGVDADLGLLIDYDDASAKGWELLGMRKPNALEAVVLTWRSKPWIFGTPTFTPWDYQADEIRLRTGPASLGHGGKRAGGKMKGIVRRVEIEAGVIEHALSVVSSKINHGPTQTGGLPPRRVLPSTRVEKPDVDPCPINNPTPAGYIPGVNIAHGQAFAHDLADWEIEQQLDAAGLINDRRRTVRILVVAARDYGVEVDETGCGDDDQIETDGELRALDETSSATVLDKIVPPSRWYALNPAA